MSGVRAEAELEVHSRPNGHKAAESWLQQKQRGAKCRYRAPAESRLVKGTSFFGPGDHGGPGSHCSKPPHSESMPADISDRGVRHKRAHAWASGQGWHAAEFHPFSNDSAQALSLSMMCACILTTCMRDCLEKAAAQLQVRARQKKTTPWALMTK